MLDLPASFPPQLPELAQAHMDYQRQRQMTLGDLLLENRIVFLQGPSTTGMPTNW